MAKKNKQLNKNLVAFLTIMGMILVVSLVFVGVWKQTRRDPEVLAEIAREREATGDLEQACRSYMRAYEASNSQETVYLLDGARCLLEMGRIAVWMGTLNTGHSKNPTDQPLMQAALDGLWHIRAIATVHTLFPVSILPERWRTFGQELYELDPENAAALAASAVGLWGMGDEELLAAGDKAANEAFALQPTDPRVAVVYAEFLRREVIAEARAASAAGGSMAEIESLDAQYRGRMRDALSGAVEANPQDAYLVINYAGVVDDVETRVEILRRSVAVAPESAELRAALALQLTYQIQIQREVLEPELRDTLLTEVEENVVRAIELDPALYDAYVVWAELPLLAGREGSESGRPSDEQYAECLRRFTEAREQTEVQRTLRAELTKMRRMRLVRRGMATALTHFMGAEDAQVAAQRLALVEEFLEDARVRHHDQPVTDYMLGQYLIAKGDLVGAIQAFESAHRQQESAQYWLVSAEVGMLPTYQLAVLYQQTGKFGEAERYARLAVLQYEREIRRIPPEWMVLTWADLLNQLGEAQAALDLVDRYGTAYPEDRGLMTARVAAMTKLGRSTSELEKAIEAVGGDDTVTRLWQARMAVARKDLAEAESLLRGVFDDASATDEQLRSAFPLLYSVMDGADRQVELLEFVRELRQDPPVGLDRALQQYEILLSETDPEARSRKLLEYIASNSDPLQKAEEYYNYYAARGELEKAVEYLTEMASLKPEELRIVEQEFNIRLKLGQFDVAGQLLVRMAQYDEGRGWDRVGGATYRGELALCQGDAETALREYREAVTSLPKSDKLQVRLAYAYLTADRVVEGTEALDLAVKINPRNFEAQWLLQEAYTARLALAQGEEKAIFEKRIASCRAAAAKLLPNHPDVLRWAEEEAEKKDPLAAIARREQRLADDPSDRVNLLNLSRLYVMAWDVVTPDSAEARQYAARGGAFFQSALEKDEAPELMLVRNAAAFHLRSGEAQKGETLLRAMLERQSGPSRVYIQLILASYYESLNSPDAAEREFRLAQRYTAEIEDAAERRALDLRVGLAFVDFFERQQRGDKLVEASRWLVDRMESGDPAEIRLVWLKLIEALLNTGDTRGASAELDRYVAVYGEDDIHGLMERAKVYLMERRREEANQTLTRLIELQPELVWALLSRGTLSLEQWHYDDARTDLEKARELMGGEPELESRIRAALATLYVRSGLPDLAIRELRDWLSVLEADGAKPEARQQVVTWLVDILRKQDNLDEARRLVSEYMERFPDDPRWPYQLGQLLESRGNTARDANRKPDATRDYNLAAQYFRRALEHCGEEFTPMSALAASGQIRVLAKADRGREAIAASQSLPIDLPSGVRMEVAKAYQSLGENQIARGQWQQALLEAARVNIVLTQTIASELRMSMSSSLPEAEALLREVAEGTPIESPAGQRLRTVLATYQTATGKAAEALVVLEALLSQAEVGTPIHRDASLTRARALELTGDTLATVAAYEHILELYPDDVTALNNLAYLLVTSAEPSVARPREALAYADRLRGLLAGSYQAATVFDTVGQVYSKNNMLEEAISVLEESLSIDKTEKNIAAYLHLGQTFQKMDRTVDAREWLTRGLEIARKGATESVRKYIEQFEEQLNKLP